MLVSVPALLSRMRRDLQREGRLRVGTAAWMWTGYGAFTTLFATTLATRPPSAALPLPVRAATVAMTGAGSLLVLAGARRFAGPAQLSDTAAGTLVTGGVYRYSRNPQYTGLLAALAGAALTRRSPTALALVGGLAAVYAAWVPAEEAHLARHFGQPYTRYRDATPRWVGPRDPARVGAGRARPSSEQS